MLTSWTIFYRTSANAVNELPCILSFEEKPSARTSLSIPSTCMQISPMTEENSCFESPRKVNPSCFRVTPTKKNTTHPMQ